MITSTQNPTIKRLVRLRERRHRDESGRFLIEGYRELWRAVTAGISIETLYVSQQLFLGDNEHTLIDACRQAGAEIVEVTEQPFRKVSYRDRPEGLLAEAMQFDTAIVPVSVCIRWVAASGTSRLTWNSIRTRPISMSLSSASVITWNAIGC